MRKLLLGVDGPDPLRRPTRYPIDLSKRRDPIGVGLINLKPKPSDRGTHGIAPESLVTHLGSLVRQASGSAAEYLSAATTQRIAYAKVDGIAESVAFTADKLGRAAMLMGGREFGSVARLLLGSTADKVLHLFSNPAVMLK